MALPASAFEPLDDDLDVDCDPATIALDADEFDESLLLMPPDADEGAAGRHGFSSSPGSVDTGTLSTRMAHRVLRDAIALQLARRGFDGLRVQPLTLVAEMAACFIGAIGTQLLLVEPAARRDATPSYAPYLPHVLRLRRHTNVRTPAEWFKLKELFARLTEFNATQGTAAAQLTRQKQPCLGGRPPAAVQQLYTALRATWHFKMTPAGRVAHVNAGQADGVARAAVEPNALQAALPPSELAQVVSLNTKARRTADAWLNGIPVGSSAAPPTLFPGAFLGAAAAEPGAQASAVKRRKPTAKAEAKNPAAGPSLSREASVG